MKKFLSLILLSVLTLSYFPYQAKAAGASLYLTPNTGTHTIGTTFKVTIKINTGGEPVNAAEGAISYDSSLLSVASISKGGSIFNLWTTEPVNSGSSISFGGGIPFPGYKGSAGTVFSITFKAKKAGLAQVRFTSGAVLANDGKGTNILASMGSASYTIAPKEEAPVEVNKPAEETTAPAKPKPKAEEPAPEEEPSRLLPKIVSLTHPDQNVWYKDRNITFQWEPTADVTGVSFAFDNNANGEPGNQSDGMIKAKDYPDTKDGVYYFHLKYQDKKGWGSTASYRVQIDNSPPLPCNFSAEQKDENDWPQIMFPAKDDLSGVAKYEIKIGSLEELAYTVDGKTAELKTKDLSSGKHTAMVKAIDAAGNEAFCEGEFMVKPLPAPEIINYARELSPSNDIFISGKAIKDAKLTLSISGENLKRKFETASDKDGNWFVASKNDLPIGTYLATAQARNINGLQTDISAPVSFMVTPPIFTRLGNFVINYFTVFVSLIFMILLIIILAIILSRLFKKKLRKETIEVEDVLKKNLMDLEKELDADFAALDGIKTAAELKKEKERIRGELNDKIETAKKKILKEIDDVEKILK